MATHCSNWSPTQRKRATWWIRWLTLLSEAGGENLASTLRDVKAKEQIDTLADTLANGEAKTLGDKRLIWRPRLLLLNTVSETLAVAEIETLRQIWAMLEQGHRSTRCIGGVNGETLVDTLANRGAKAEARTQRNTLGHVGTRALIDTLTDKLLKA